MFEMIGLIFATAVFFAVSGVASILYGIVAWLILRGRGRKTSRLRLLTALCLPVVCAAYMFAFGVLWTSFVPSAHESLFGDISEPLPNGFLLEGLAKMPDYAHVNSPGDPFASNPPGDVGEIVVEGPIIFTSISRPFGQPEHAASERGFYEFDTRARTGRQFATQSQMELAAGHHINLVPTIEFRTLEPATVRVRRLGTALLFAPVAAVLLLHLAYLLQLRLSRQIDYA